ACEGSRPMPPASTTPADSKGERMKDRPCSMAPMVEANRDGRLEAREIASLERHLAGCATCRALAQDLSRLGELAARRGLAKVTALEPQPGRVALLRAAAVESPSFGSRTPGPAGAPSRARVAAALAFAAALALSVGALLRGQGREAAASGPAPSP